jgi:hypothetical protein
MDGSTVFNSTTYMLLIKFDASHILLSKNGYQSVPPAHVAIPSYK